MLTQPISSANVLQVQAFVSDEMGSTGAPEVIGSPVEPVGKGLDIITDGRFSRPLDPFIQAGFFPIRLIFGHDYAEH